MPGEVDLRYDAKDKEWVPYDDETKDGWWEAKFCQWCGIDLSKLILKEGGTWGAKYN